MRKESFFFPQNILAKQKQRTSIQSEKIRSAPEQFLSLIAGFVCVKDPSIFSHVPPSNHQQQDCAKKWLYCSVALLIFVYELSIKTDKTHRNFKQTSPDAQFSFSRRLHQAARQQLQPSELKNYFLDQFAGKCVLVLKQNQQKQSL